ncbi:MAG: YeiH family protein [Peptococcaceae bacterium]|nr:YeiH family protein [Peptococcaceae bacterium]
MHEVGHVVSAATVGGKVGADIAILVKLGRVALLIPVALVMGYLFKKGGISDGQTESSFSCKRT